MVNDTTSCSFIQRRDSDWQRPQVVARYFGMPQFSFIDFRPTGLDAYSSSQVGKSFYLITNAKLKDMTKLWKVLSGIIIKLPSFVFF